jgi:hypothetical protein
MYIGKHVGYPIVVWWSSRHIARVDKMRAYNQANLQADFGLLSTVSPQKVRFEEE